MSAIEPEKETIAHLDSTENYAVHKGHGDTANLSGAQLKEVYNVSGGAMRCDPGADHSGHAMDGLMHPNWADDPRPPTGRAVCGCQRVQDREVEQDLDAPVL
jgi:hypothetical protein